MSSSRSPHEFCRLRCDGRVAVRDFGSQLAGGRCGDQVRSRAGWRALLQGSSPARLAGKCGAWPMAFDTVAARNRDTERWRTALAVSLCLHVAVVIYALTVSSVRRAEPAATPLVVTILPEEAAPLPSHAPAPVVAVAESGRSATPPGRPRSDRAANRPAPRPLAPPSAEKSPALATAPVPEVVQAASLQGDLLVPAASAPAGSSAGPAGVVVSAASGSEASAAPRILPPAEGNGQLAIDPNEARYQPAIPPRLRKPGARFAPLVKLCVRKDGSVGEVTVMRPSDPAVDPAIVEKIRLFKFRPYLDHGRPIPFCFFREYQLSVEE